MSASSRALGIARGLLRLVAWPFTGEVQHARESPEEAEQRLREMTLAKRDQSH
jgi:hypothetical protein